MLQNKISTQRRNKILACFCEDITATATAGLARVNRNTVNYYFNKIRKILLLASLQEGGVEIGEFELDESYFGAKRVRGKRGRGAAGKTPVFGLLKRGGKVFVKIVKNCSKEELLPVIQGKILEKSVIYTDGWKAYDGLMRKTYNIEREKEIKKIQFTDAYSLPKSYSLQEENVSKDIQVRQFTFCDDKLYGVNVYYRNTSHEALKILLNALASKFGKLEEKEYYFYKTFVFYQYYPELVVEVYNGDSNNGRLLFVNYRWQKFISEYNNVF